MNAFLTAKHFPQNDLPKYLLVENTVLFFTKHLFVLSECLIIYGAAATPYITNRNLGVIFLASPIQRQKVIAQKIKFAFLKTELGPFGH